MGKVLVVRTGYTKAGIKCLVTIIVAGFVGACSPTPPTLSGPQFLQKSGGSPLNRTYKLGVGDKLKVGVFGEENLSGEFDVNASGNISLPLLGEMQARGLSLEDLRRSIQTRLSNGYLTNPKVTIDMLNYRPIYIHGEVKNGGEFQFKNGLRLRDAIAMAGGYTYRANQDYIVVGRDGASDVAVQAAADIPLLPGDNVRIPERFF